METITLTKKQLNSLKLYHMEKEIMNTEAEIFILDKGNWHYSKSNLLLKKLYMTDLLYMSNKLLTVSLLNSKKKEIGLDELVIPKHLVSSDNELIGFTIPHIKDSMNLGVFLKDLKVDISQKIKYLSKVGELLRKVKTIRDKNILNFYFGDLHEYNFLLKEKEEKIYAVDLDSSYLNTNYPLPSHYLYTNNNISNFSNKYRANELGITYPTENSDLFCYNMMILNTIAHDKVSRLDMVDYFNYINYLEYLGFGRDLLKSFKRLYSNGNNINVSSFLDQIPIDKSGESLYKVYDLKRKKGLIKF